MHIICAYDFLLGLEESFATSDTYKNDHVTPKNHENFGILYLWNFENFCNFLKYLFPWKLSTRWLSLIFFKVHGFRHLENLKNPSWRSLRSDVIGDKVFLKSPKPDKSAISAVWEVWAENSPKQQPN